MKGEDKIIELLMQSLQNQDEMKKSFIEMNERLERVETRVDHMEERFNKVEWRHDDLTLKHEDLRHQISVTTKAVNDLTLAVAAMVNAQTHTETRIQRLERPNDFGPQAAAA